MSLRFVHKCSTDKMSGNGSGNGLRQTRRLAIIWTNEDPLYWHMYIRHSISIQRCGCVWSVTCTSSILPAKPCQYNEMGFRMNYYLHNFCVSHAILSIQNAYICLSHRNKSIIMLPQSMTMASYLTWQLVRISVTTIYCYFIMHLVIPPSLPTKIKTSAICQSIRSTHPAGHMIHKYCSWLIHFCWIFYWVVLYQYMRCGINSTVVRHQIPLLKLAESF